jgi:DGQHR domain-containing protein
MPDELRLPAIEMRQSKGRKLYSFAVDGKKLHDVVTVSRVRRNESGAMSGYQRPEALAHVQEIRAYLESDSPMLPNAFVLAFDSRVRFEPAPGEPLPSAPPYVRMGTLVIPRIKGIPDEEKPGFVVDGQQRLAAIRDADIKQFPIFATAFITNDVQQQTEQFILVNSTKSLNKGLIYELLPHTQAHLPTLLHRRKLPSLLMERLNLDKGSPMAGMIRTTTNPSGIIKDNSILRMLENSQRDGALFRFLQSEEDGGADTEQMLRLLFNYWSGVAEVFRAAWGLAPKKSRLMHGVGIISMGHLMDAIGRRLDKVLVPTREQYIAELTPMKEFTHWTAGTWSFGPGKRRKWNELQNAPGDTDLLSTYLVTTYQKQA